jgi:hypothetical protein
MEGDVDREKVPLGDTEGERVGERVLDVEGVPVRDTSTVELARKDALPLTVKERELEEEEQGEEERVPHGVGDWVREAQPVGEPEVVGDTLPEREGEAVEDADLQAVGERVDVGHNDALTVTLRERVTQALDVAVVVWVRVRVAHPVALSVASRTVLEGV